MIGKQLEHVFVMPVQDQLQLHWYLHTRHAWSVQLSSEGESRQCM